VHHGIQPVSESGAGTRPAAVPVSSVVAVFIGNGLEFYDFCSYGLFAVYIGNAFFPSSDHSLSLLLSLATFGIGFVFRPIGAIVLGTLGDRLGRKPAMLISFFLMGVGMLGIGLTPSYAQIGITAPLLAVGFRLVQGFALGGEVGPATAYMVEAAPPERRGLYGSMQFLTQDAGSLLAALVGLTLSSLLSQQALQSWGWRIAFLLGVIIVPFGLFMRNRLSETLDTTDEGTPAAAATPVPRPPLTPYLPIIVCILVLFSAGSIGSYVLDYMTTYSLDTLRLSAKVSFGVVVVTSLCAMGCRPISGLLSDRYGRKRIIMAGYALSSLLVLPTFWIINRYPSTLHVYGLLGLISATYAIGIPPVIVALTEALPKRVRSGVVATAYAFAISVFGGSTQFVVTWFIRRTGDPLAPAWYWVAAMMLALVAASILPETAPLKREAGSAGPPSAPQTASAFQEIPKNCDKAQGLSAGCSSTPET
jgi:MFS transporter, MHS family, citrate/tricarballylate:H+ symporter